MAIAGVSSPTELARIQDRLEVAYRLLDKS